MKDLEKASRRLVDAARTGEPILVYADYDADGTTGAACLLLFLSDLFPGTDVRIHQNNRIVDGYGLKRNHLEAAAKAGVKLVVTVDGGITDGEAVRIATAAGMDVIITDHHVPGETLPPAFAVLNPKRRDCPYPEKDLAGVGVIFLLMCGVRRLLRITSYNVCYTKLLRPEGEPCLPRYREPRDRDNSAGQVRPPGETPPLPAAGA